MSTCVQELVRRLYFQKKIHVVLTWTTLLKSIGMIESLLVYVVLSVDNVSRENQIHK